MKKVFAAALLALLISGDAAAQYPPTDVVPVRLADRPAQGSITLTAACTSAGVSTAGCVTAGTQGISSALVTITGTFVQTLAFQGTPADGGAVASALNVSCRPWGGGLGTTSTAVAGSWICPTQGLQRLSVVGTVTSGTAVVSIEGTAAASFVSTSAENSVRTSYSQSVSITVPTSASSMMALESDATNKMRLRYLKICLGVGALQTTAGARVIVLFRTTAASTGGSAVTPLVMGAEGEAAFGGISRNGALTTTPAVYREALRSRSVEISDRRVGRRERSRSRGSHRRIWRNRSLQHRRGVDDGSELTRRLEACTASAPATGQRRRSLRRRSAALRAGYPRLACAAALRLRCARGPHQRPPLGALGRGAGYFNALR